MEDIYLTPNLFIQNYITYYTDDINNKNIKINYNNWHKYLSEYGWDKIDYGWIRRLNKYKNIKEKNSRWGIRDCGGEGDCLFYVISEAIGEPDMDMLSIRKLVSEQINNNNFIQIIETYKLAYEANEFIGEWNPNEIKNKEDLKNEIIKIGNNFWGDHIILQLLENVLSINFILLNSEKIFDSRRANLKKRFNVYNIGQNYIPNRKTIILYYIDSSHFKLVGYFFDNYMCTLFDKIPDELLYIYREDCHQIE